jgi:hypothetical protein
MTADDQEPQPTDVKIYVYDISHGLAKVYSKAIVGIELDAIYHTSIVAFGYEYYFDREGPTKLPAGQTRFGTPHQILDLGETHIPQEIFEEYLEELKSERFKFGSYDLFFNNCNHFTHEVVQFANNGVLDSRILHLPEQVLTSPNGAMIQQLFSGGF